MAHFAILRIIAVKTLAPHVGPTLISKQLNAHSIQNKARYGKISRIASEQVWTTFICPSQLSLKPMFKMIGQGPHCVTKSGTDLQA